MSDARARTLADAARAEASLRRVAGLADMSTSQLTAVLRDPDRAAPWVRAAAIHGVREAQLRLGRMLLEGEGVEKDAAAALRWFGRAAKAGDGEAMNMVGRCHENGWGTLSDDHEACAWYRRSAETGHDWGEYNYAHMLFDGRGVPLDRVEALKWYRRAAERGHARAMNLVGRCLEAGWGAGPDPAAAEVWYERSARAGYYRAQYNHALTLLRRGRVREAEDWLARAYEAGDAAMRAQIEALSAPAAQPSLASAAAGTMVTLSPQPQASVSLGLWKTNLADSLLTS